jgi:hypothetical protein
VIRICPSDGRRFRQLSLADLLLLSPKAGWIFGSGWSKFVLDEPEGYLETGSKYR